MLDDPDDLFLQSLGTNGRSCHTCHEPQTGMTLSPGARPPALRGDGPRTSTTARRERLRDVVRFYDVRFGLQLTQQEKSDLEAFLADL